MDELDAVEIVEQLGGVATRAQLERLLGRDRLDDAVREGRLERIGRGRYALPGLHGDLRAARSIDGVIAGLSAARYWVGP